MKGGEVNFESPLWRRKAAGLLATARVANLPSVISNVWVGIALGALVSPSGFDPFGWWRVILLTLSGAALYVGGNFANDWIDQQHDSQKRPERALPQRLFKPSTYLTISLLAGLLGLVSAFWVNPTSGWIATSIGVFVVIYTATHKRSAWAVIPMGMCRALLPLMGALAFHPYVDFFWPAATALLLYIIGLSLCARYESMTAPPKWVGIVARGALLGTAILMAIGNQKLLAGSTYALCAAAPYLAWTSYSLRFRRRPVSKLVSSLLAGIPWVDWMILLPIALRQFLVVEQLASPFHWVCLLLPPVAFLAALSIQRISPAT